MIGSLEVCRIMVVWTVFRVLDHDFLYFGDPDNTDHKFWDGDHEELSRESHAGSLSRCLEARRFLVFTLEL